MNNYWRWGISLGSVFWVVSIMVWLVIPIELIVKSLDWLMEGVSLTVGVIYCLSEDSKLNKKVWKIIFSEIGIMLFVVLLSWSLLLVLSSLMLDVRMEVSEYLDESLNLNNFNIENWNQLKWVPSVLIRMLISLLLPVGLVKFVMRATNDLNQLLKRNRRGVV